VITVGRRAAAADLLASPAELGRRGIALEHVSRGGAVTYHGPGQLVGYPIVRLERGVVGHLRAMADGLVEVLSRHGVQAEWRREAPGLWVTNRTAAADDGAGVAGGVAGNVGRNVTADVTVDGTADGAADGAAKIAAFGVHVHHRVAIHGFALNLTVDLDPFRLIVPCGLAGAAVTSLQAITGRSPPIESVAVEVAAAFSRSFGRQFRRRDDRDPI
jgi:lipoyl(octanoyl) transferase